MMEEKFFEKHETFLNETEERIRLYCRNNGVSYAEITAELRKRADDRIFVYAVKIKTTGHETRVESLLASLEKNNGKGYIDHIESGAETITLLFSKRSPAKAAQILLLYYQIPSKMLTAVFTKPENIPEE